MSAKDDHIQDGLLGLVWGLESNEQLLLTEGLVSVVQVVVDREIAERRTVGEGEYLHVGHDHESLQVVGNL